MDLSRRRFSLGICKGAAGISALPLAAKLTPAAADTEIPEALKPQDVCPEQILANHLDTLADEIDKGTFTGWLVDRDKTLEILNPDRPGNLVRGMIRKNKRIDTSVPPIATVQAYSKNDRLHYDLPYKYIDDGALSFSFGYTDDEVELSKIDFFKFQGQSIARLLCIEIRNGNFA